MAKKKYDLAVKVGEYTDKGAKKNRYVNIGSVMVNDDGGEFLLIDRTFNPAGVPNPDNKDSILVSKFDVNKKGGKDPAPLASPAAPQKPMIDDSIPF